MKRRLALLMLFFLSLPVFSASFDCSNARSPTESAICAQPGLSDQDDEMAEAYSALLKAISNPRVLRAEQRKWLTEVRNRCTDTGCLEQEYKKRIAHLKKSLIDISSDIEEEEEVLESSSKVMETAATPSTPVTTPASATQEAAREIEAPQQNQASPENSQAQQSSLPEEALSHPAAAATTSTNIEEQLPQESTPNASESYLTSLQLKLIGLALFIIVVLTIYLHKKDKLVIYQDYTDATITGCAPLVALVAYAALAFFEVPDSYARLIALSTFAAIMIFVVKSTAKNNNSALYFFLSLTTKVTIVGLYYAIMAALLTKSNSPRRNGERQSAYEARLRREAQQNAEAIAAVTVGFGLLSAWVCKNNEFTPVGEYFSLTASSQ